LRNVEVAKGVIRRAIPLIPEERRCPCPTALKDAIITAKEAIPPEVKEKLKVLIGRYV